MWWRFMAEVLVKVQRGAGIGHHEWVRVFWDSPEEGQAEYGKLVDEYLADPWGTQTRADVKSAEERLAELRTELAAGQGFQAHDDIGWYLQEIVRLAGRVSDELKCGNADVAALKAASYGYLRSELRMKLEWEKEALAGKATKDGGRKGGTAPRTKSDSVASRQQPLLDAYWRSRDAGGQHERAMDRAVTATGYSRRQALRLLGPLK